MIDFLQANNSVYIIFTVVLGLIVGSFLNVVIHRLPPMLKRQWRQQCVDFLGQKPDIDGIEKTYNLAIPSSHCPHCLHPIGIWENIPLISFLLLRGRCRHCKTKIALRYPLVELLTAIVSGVIAWQFFATIEGVVALLFSWSMIALIFIDIDEQILPDIITLPVLWLGLLVNAFGYFASAQDAIIGALAGYLILWSITKFYYLLTKREGMGHGDFKLLAAIGAWLGWQALLPTILIASLAGIVIGGGLMLLRRQHRHTLIAFGPYLATAGWLVMIGPVPNLLWF